MTTKKKILIGVLVVIAAVTVWCILYYSLQNIARGAQLDGVFAVVADHVETDAEFSAQYGAVRSVAPYENNKKIEALGSHLCVVPCVVETEEGTEYLVWVEYNFEGETDVFRYLEIVKQEK